MRIAIGADHAGFRYKERLRQLLAGRGHEVTDFGTDSEQPPGARTLPFDGGESKIVVDAIAPGSDGAKLLADYESRAGIASSADRKRFAMRFSAKDGTSFVFYGVDATRARK